MDILIDRLKEYCLKEPVLPVGGEGVEGHVAEQDDNPAHRGHRVVRLAGLLKLKIDRLI